jgi:hypothetical protein
MNARCTAGLGVLAVGLGVGAAVAAMPAVASADSSTDPFAWLAGLDLGDPTVPATSTSGLHLAISIDGYSPVSDGSASAESSTGDIAIAYGSGAEASAVGGYGDVAAAYAWSSCRTYPVQLTIQLPGAIALVAPLRGRGASTPAFLDSQG